MSVMMPMLKNKDLDWSMLKLTAKEVLSRNFMWVDSLLFNTIWYHKESVDNLDYEYDFYLDL